MTDDLATWLLEQIAEDRRVVEGALKRTRNWKQIDRPWWRLKHGPQRPLRPEEMLLAVWDPDRLLAECDAKRRIIAEHAERVTTAPIPAEGWREVRLGECKKCADWASETEDGTLSDVYPCTTLKLVALPYAGRPGYREEWAPYPLDPEHQTSAEAVQQRVQEMGGHEAWCQMLKPVPPGFMFDTFSCNCPGVE